VIDRVDEPWLTVPGLEVDADTVNGAPDDVTVVTVVVVEDALLVAAIWTVCSY
jgi:hypothetical protein